MTFKERYVKEMDEMSLSESFEVRTVNLMKQTAYREDEKAFMKRKTFKVFAVAIIIIALLSATVFAFSYLLSAKEVAENIGGEKLAGLFEDGEAETQTISNGVYDVVFLGKASGTRFNKTVGFEVEELRTYAVFAIKKTDGTPLSLTEGMPVQLAPVIEGYMPFMTWGVLEGASGMEKDGVLYYLFDYENLEIFADRTVSVVVLEPDMFPTSEILTLDENGSIIYGEGYDGIRGIFNLPMDESKADPEAAKELLGNY